MFVVLFWLCGHVGNDARAAWKALKDEYQDRVQEVEELIGTFRLRVEEIQGKRQMLETLLSTLQKKVLRTYDVFMELFNINSLLCQK